MVVRRFHSNVHLLGVEPLYNVNRDSDEELPDATYFNEDAIKHPLSIPGDFPPDMSEKEAWEGARTEAHANHRI